MPDLIVPDSIEPIVGRRCWGLAKIGGKILLCSAASHTVWPGDERFTAECSKSHAPPGDDCTCGIYALAETEPWPYYDFDGGGQAVWGEVFLWGTVVKGEKGYRAQFAYPKRLYLAHKDYCFLKRLSESYRGVPISLRNPYPEVESGHR